MTESDVLHDGWLAGAGRRLAGVCERAWASSALRAMVVDLWRDVARLEFTEGIRLVGSAALAALAAHGIVGGFAALRDGWMSLVVWIAFAAGSALAAFAPDALARRLDVRSR